MIAPWEKRAARAAVSLHRVHVARREASRTLGLAASAKALGQIEYLRRISATIRHNRIDLPMLYRPPNRAPRLSKTPQKRASIRLKCQDAFQFLGELRPGTVGSDRLFAALLHGKGVRHLRKRKRLHCRPREISAVTCSRAEARWRSVLAGRPPCRRRRCRSVGRNRLCNFQQTERAFPSESDRLDVRPWSARKPAL